jgi:SSS family solute:Na+ symporter
MLVGMPIIFRRVCILLLWMCGVSMGIGAEGLISLKVMPLSAAEAAKAEARPFLAEAPPLEGAAAGCQPLVAVAHYDSIWVLALNPSGSQVWLEHNTRLGWRLRSAPPAVIRPELQAGGQAHLLAVATPENREAVLYTYHAITDTWATVGRVPLTGTLTGVRPSEGGFVLATRGEDGVEQFNQLTIALTKRLLNWIDWLIIVIYLVGTAGIGFYYYKREQKQSGEEFFLGGRSIPWWAAGVSLYATGTSAISYIATPAKSFAENWLYLAANIVGIIGTAFTAIWIVPLLRRLSLMSVYHYLEMRYHPRIRTLASALAIVIQLGGRMSIVLFLPSLAMSAVTGLNVTHSILIMGVVTILYTVLGGMRAVIWTDFIQVVVMLGGAFVALGFVVTRIDGGVGAFFKTAMADGKFRTFDWAFDLTQPTVWGFLLVTFLGIMTIPQDQVMMQRVLATKSDKEAGWSMWTLAAIVIPGNLTFFGIGTALYVYYKHFPSHLNPMLNVDSTFPQFIAAELPAGVTGLIIAGIFAASMSTLSSCMNSVATLVSVDFFERYGKKITPLQSVRIAEITTVVAGLVGIGTALLLATVNIKSALDANFEIMALLGGGFAGCYALGLFTTRANWQGVMIGVFASFVFTFLAWNVRLVHPFFYMPLAVLSCCVVGYFTSFLFPAPTQSLTGLTIYTPR